MEEEGQVLEPSEADIVGRIANVLNPSEEEQPQEETQETTEEAPEQEETEAPEEEGPSVDPDAPFIQLKHKIEGGGDQEETLSINQLKAGYMMQKDYQRKTAEVARARETITKEVEQAISQDRKTYIEGLQIAEQALLAMVVPELNGADMEKLAIENPSEAVRLQAKAHKLNQTVNAIRNQLAQANKQANDKMAAESKRALSDPISGIPGWGDELYTSIISDAKSYGFTAEEVANVVDHRMIRVLHDALQFNKAKSAKPKPATTPAPKVLKPGTPQGKSGLQAQQEKQLSQRLQKSGSIEDAAALYLARTKR